MTPLAAIQEILQALSLTGSALTAIKLFKTGLYTRYKIFFWYFIFRGLGGLLPLLVDVQSNLYFVLWQFTEPVDWLFNIAVILELYRLVLERHQGIQTLGRWAMYLGIAVSVAVSVLMLLPRISPALPEKSRGLFYYLGIQRGLYLSIAIFIVFMLLFLSRFPIPLSRNVLVHVGLFSAFFFSSWIATLLRAVLGIDLSDELNLALIGIAAACVWCWFFLLSAQGEKPRGSLPFISPEYEHRVLAQLDALNATLLKVARK